MYERSSIFPFFANISVLKACKRSNFDLTVVLNLTKFAKKLVPIDRIISSQTFPHIPIFPLTAKVLKIKKNLLMFWYLILKAARKKLLFWLAAASAAILVWLDPEWSKGHPRLGGLNKSEGHRQWRPKGLMVSLQGMEEEVCGRGGRPYVVGMSSSSRL